MTEKDLDIAIEKCERIMEMDVRTMHNPVSENGWIFEKVYELLQYLRQFEFATDINVGGNLIDRQAALDAVDDIHQEHLYKQIGDKDTYTPYNEGWADACDRIDAALSALPSAQLAQDLTNGCTDTISRQAAIEAMRKAKDKSELHRMLVQLPSAQPTCTENVPVDDCISRQAAVNAICEDGTQLERQGQYSMTMVDRKYRDTEILEALPPAQPGWIPCSESPMKNNSYLVWMPFAPEGHHITVAEWCGSYWNIKTPITAWMPLPKPWEGGQNDGKN